MASHWKVLGGERFREVANGKRGGVRIERVLMLNQISSSQDVLDLLSVCEVRPGGERRGNCKLALTLDVWRHLLPVIQEALTAESKLPGVLDSLGKQPSERVPGGFQMPAVE